VGYIYIYIYIYIYAYMRNQFVYFLRTVDMYPKNHADNRGGDLFLFPTAGKEFSKSFSQWGFEKGTGSYIGSFLENLKPKIENYGYVPETSPLIVLRTAVRSPKNRRVVGWPTAIQTWTPKMFYPLG
jgi:hypothetical protein